MTTSLPNGAFWQNLPYRSKIERRRDNWNESSFPYRPRHRPRRHAVPTSNHATWQVNITNRGVSVHSDRPLCAMFNVTADHRAENSSKEKLEQLNRNYHLVDQNKSGRILDKKRIYGAHQESLKVANSELLSQGICQLGLRETPTEKDMPSSWWSRHVRHLGRLRQPIDIWEKANIFHIHGQPICPCSSCASPQSSLRSIEVSTRLKQTNASELDTLRQRPKGFIPIDWIRRHRQGWNEIPDAPPLTAETLKHLRVRDITLEIERTQLLNELSMTQGFLHYISDAISRVQPHNQVRVHLIREYRRLKDQEISLIDHLQDIEHEMDRIDEIENSKTYEFADFSHESILASIEQPSFSSTSSFESCRIEIQALDMAKAKAELELYNKSWIDIRNSMKSSKLPKVLPLVPWLTSSPEFSGLASERQDWRLTAYKFFCAPFSFATLMREDEESGKSFEFISASGDSEDAIISLLKGLKEQLKLERTRWHEDKLRALFGDEVAVDKKAKDVWSAVVELKSEVVTALEDRDR